MIRIAAALVITAVAAGAAVQAAAATRANIWPAANSALVGEINAAAATRANGALPAGNAAIGEISRPGSATTPASVKVIIEPVVDDNLNEIMAGRHNVSTALPEIAQTVASAAHEGATAQPPRSAAVANKLAERATVTAAHPRTPHPAGGTSWTTRALAALGGAAAAGATGWFLIRRRRSRADGEWRMANGE